MTDYKLLWNKIFKDLNNDDIVLEIKILDTNIEDWENTLILLNNKFSTIINNDKTSIDISQTYNLDVHSFPKTEKDTIENISLSFNHFDLTLTLYTIEEIEFFSDSVVKLKAEEMSSLFAFCEEISNNLLKNIYIYCEGYEKYSAYFNPDNKMWME